MIHIGVYGTEADLNKELSRRGLHRVSSIHTVLYDKGVQTSNCLIVGDYKTPAYKKCKRWFMEAKLNDKSSGRLEMFSVWEDDLKPLWGARKVEKAI